MIDESSNPLLAMFGFSILVYFLSIMKKYLPFLDCLGITYCIEIEKLHTTATMAAEGTGTSQVTS